MKYKIVIPENIASIEALKKEVEHGGRFVVYSYCISLFFAVTLRRISPAFFIPNDAPTTLYKKKYNILNYLFGWWCIPWGFIHTPANIKMNNKGGLDVTKDIMLNLNDDTFEEGYVTLNQMHSIYDIPPKEEIKALAKAVSKRLQPEVIIDELHFAYFVNVPDDAEPYFVVGIKTSQNYEDVVNALDKAIHKEFFKRVYFEYINLEQADEDEAILLIEQGVKII